MAIDPSDPSKAELVPDGIVSYDMPSVILGETFYSIEKDQEGHFVVRRTYDAGAIKTISTTQQDGSEAVEIDGRLYTVGEYSDSVTGREWYLMEKTEVVSANERLDFQIVGISGDIFYHVTRYGQNEHLSLIHI